MEKKEIKISLGTVICIFKRISSDDVNKYNSNIINCNWHIVFKNEKYG